MHLETDERPWGRYTVIDEGDGYKVKRIEVLPGKRLSYQRHQHRGGRGRKGRALGRGSAAGQGIVDVDLGDLGVDIEGKELSISRQQAQLFLDAEGDFKLRCLGRREMVVNGETLHKGEVATLPHLSLIRVGHVAVLFIVNKMALERLQKKSAGMSVY